MSVRFLFMLRAWSLAICALCAGPGVLAAYPDRLVTLVVPYPPGGATDVLARILAKGLAQRLGQPVVVENKAGAGTAIGATAVLEAFAAGTPVISSNTTFTVNAALKRTLPYDPQQQFEGVGLIGSSPLVLLAHPSLPANTVPELVALAQKQPGKMSFGSFGTGTTSHLAGELFRMMTGAEMLHVPYRGSAPAMTDLIGGQVSLTFDTNVAAMPQIAAGKVKAIAVTSRKRYSGLPDVPTVAEAGFPDYEMVPWIAVVAPRGLPADVRTRLSKALQQTIADNATHAELEKAGVEVAWQPGAVYDERVSRELPLLRAYVHKAKLPIE